MDATLSDLPGLQPPEQLDSAITIRITNTDRERLQRAAADLDVPVGRLLRAIARRALAGERTNAGIAQSRCQGAAWALHRSMHC